MSIPEGLLELAIGGIIAFIFKVVFGLIAKNEAKSDEADHRIEAMIQEVHARMNAMDDKYRANDRELYKQSSDLNAEIKGLQARLDCHK